MTSRHIFLPAAGSVYSINIQIYSITSSFWYKNIWITNPMFISALVSVLNVLYSRRWPQSCQHQQSTYCVCLSLCQAALLSPMTAKNKTKVEGELTVACPAAAADVRRGCLDSEGERTGYNNCSQKMWMLYIWERSSVFVRKGMKVLFV